MTHETLVGMKLPKNVFVFQTALSFFGFACLVLLQIFFKRLINLYL